MIPINLFSTKSTLLIPFLPATIFNFCNSFFGDNFLPLTVIGSPFLKLILTYEALLGAFSGEVVLWKIYSGAWFFGFSRTLPSVEVWNKLSSIEKGGAPFLSFVIGMLCFFAYSIRSDLELSFHNLHGAIILIFGPN